MYRYPAKCDQTDKPTEEDVRTFLHAYSMNKYGQWAFHGDGTYFGEIIELKAHQCFVPKDMSIYGWKQKSMLRYLLNKN